MGKTCKLIDAESTLKAVFKDMFDKTNDCIRAAVRHGISNAINKIKGKTEANISSSWFRSSSSEHYSSPLIKGVKAYLYNGELTGFVDILGNTRTNDGTWRLRFFEGGTKIRKSKNGKNYGRIRETWFFDSAVSSIGSDAVDMISQSVSSAIEEINKANN